MEIIFAIIFIAFAIVSENAKKQKKAQEKMKQILSEAEKNNPTASFLQTVQNTSQSGTGTGSSAFSQVRRQGTKAVFPSSDPGRVSVQRTAQTRKPIEIQQSAARSASRKDSPLMRKTMTQREKFERASATYETSNRMDVRYTSNGCGCTTGKGNAAYGSTHGRTNAMYDEARFFKESREICSGKWS